MIQALDQEVRRPVGRRNVRRCAANDSASWHSRQGCERPLGSSQMVHELQHRPRFFKAATKSESSGEEFGVLEDDWYSGILKRRYLVHELMFACSPLPPPRLQISHTIVTQAGWCVVRAVARCEAGLLPVITTVESGSQVFWH